MTSWKNSTVRWLRVIHRDLGYLMVGISLVYGISGMLLNHMDGKDPSYKSEHLTVQFASGLDGDGLSTAWRDQDDVPRLRNVMPIDGQHIRLLLEGGVGVYNRDTGVLDYETHRKRPFAYWVNKLHYNRVNGWSIMADFFAISLIFFAVSGLFMVRGRKGLFGRGKWFLAVGLLIPVFYLLLT